MPKDVLYSDTPSVVFSVASRPSSGNALRESVCCARCATQRRIVTFVCQKLIVDCECSHAGCSRVQEMMQRLTIGSITLMEANLQRGASLVSKE